MKLSEVKNNTYYKVMVNGDGYSYYMIVILYNRKQGLFKVLLDTDKSRNWTGLIKNFPAKPSSTVKWTIIKEEELVLEMLG